MLGPFGLSSLVGLIFYIFEKIGGNDYNPETPLIGFALAGFYASCMLTAFFLICYFIGIQ
jgi:hypothetical protein